MCTLITTVIHTHTHTHSSSLDLSQEPRVLVGSCDCCCKIIFSNLPNLHCIDRDRWHRPVRRTGGGHNDPNPALLWSPYLAIARWLLFVHNKYVPPEPSSNRQMRNIKYRIRNGRTRTEELMKTTCFLRTLHTPYTRTRVIKSSVYVAIIMLLFVLEFASFMSRPCFFIRSARANCSPIITRSKLHFYYSYPLVGRKCVKK